MRDALVDLEGTINGLRNVGIGLILVIVAGLALALHAWQRICLSEEEIAAEAIAQMPPILYGHELPDTGEENQLALLVRTEDEGGTRMYRWTDGRWSEVPDDKLYAGRV